MFDFKGITSKLDHIVESGFGAVWMSPIFVSPMVDFGYDISDFYNIQPEYGTMADFEELVEKAHNLGMTNSLLQFNEIRCLNDGIVITIYKQPQHEKETQPLCHRRNI